MKTKLTICRFGHQLLIKPLLAMAMGALVLCSQPVTAQIVVATDLHPAGATASKATGISGSQAVGYAVISSSHAALWSSGTAGSFLDLNPSGASSSVLYATDGSGQAGNAIISGASHAGLWFGTSGTFKDLNSAAGASQSFAFGISDLSGSQKLAGTAFISGQLRAGLWTWSGTAASFVNLNPAGASASQATSISGSQPAGYATISLSSHAGYWSSGTAASFVDLHPSGATASVAYGISGSQQAGYATISSANHAALWSGLASTFVDLNPAGASESVANGISGSQQVGFATIGGLKHAALWSETAASFMDLHALSGTGFTTSEALGVWTDGTTTQVAGYAFDTAGAEHAMLWTVTVPEPQLFSMVVALGLLGTTVWFRNRQTKLSL